jgi:hypothetical protein
MAVPPGRSSSGREACVGALHDHGLGVVQAGEAGGGQLVAHGLRHGALLVSERVEVAAVEQVLELVRQREAGQVFLLLLVARPGQRAVDVPAVGRAIQAGHEVGGLGAVLVAAVAHFVQAVFDRHRGHAGQLFRRQVRLQVFAEQRRAGRQREVGRIRRDAGGDLGFGVGGVEERP